MTDTEQTKSELLPCPFCGREIPAMYGVQVICERCGAGTMVCDTAQEAIAAWNRRATPSHTALEALREALEPFSEIAGEYFARDLSRHETIVAVTRSDGEWLKITAGNLYDARAAYAAPLASQEPRQEERT